MRGRSRRDQHWRAEETLLSEGWNLVLTEADACANPHDLPLSAQMIAAEVPGTVAAALEKVGLFDRENPKPLDGKDAWYVCRLFDAEPGEAILRFEGLATLCHVFLERSGNPLFSRACSLCTKCP
jgi:beta-mannosidase